MTTELFFSENNHPLHTHSTPGRLDVMGGFADYSGSLVLQMPIGERVHVSLAFRNDTTIRMHVQTKTQLLADKIVSFENEKPGHVPDTQKSVESRWTQLILACADTFWQSSNVLAKGLDIWAAIDIPLQKELAEKSALCLSVIQTLAQAYNSPLAETEASLLAHQALQRVDSSACLADALTQQIGPPHALLPILCQPGHVSAPVFLPEGVHLVWLDTDVAQPEENSIYQQIKTAAFMGYSMMALSDGVFPHELDRARRTGNREELLYNGYLANITPTEFESRYKWLPPYVKGSVFLEKSGLLIDPTLTVEPETVYPIVQAMRHPMYENVRCQYFSLLLQHLPPITEAERREKSLQQLGNWLFQSHDSYKACGLSHPKADALVQQVKSLAGQGVYGARITDRGAGGSVCVLCEGEKGLEAVGQL